MHVILAALLLVLPNPGQGRVSSCTDGTTWTVNVGLVDGVGLDSYGTDWSLLIGYRDDNSISGNQPNWWDVPGRDSIDALRATIGWPPYLDPKWITQGGSVKSWRALDVLGAAPEAVSGGQITVTFPVAAVGGTTSFPATGCIDVWGLGTDGTHVPLCSWQGPTYFCPGANSKNGGVRSNGGVKKSAIEARHTTFGRVQTIYR